MEKNTSSSIRPVEAELNERLKDHQEMQNMMAALKSKIQEHNHETIMFLVDAKLYQFVSINWEAMERSWRIR
jgi:hypothetical protein